MDTSSLIIISVVIFGLSISIPLLLIRQLALVSSRHVTIITVSYFLVWFLFVNIGYSTLHSLNLTLFVSGIFFFIGIVALISYSDISKAISRIPSSLLVKIQAYRILGFIFLYLYFKEGALSLGFAMVAGIGDMIIGITAIPVSNAMSKNTSRFIGMAMSWNIAGMTDLVLAPTAAVLFGNQGLTDYPLILVPAFIGPPLSILIHIASLKNINRSAVQHKRVSKNEYK